MQNWINERGGEGDYAWKCEEKGGGNKWGENFTETVFNSSLFAVNTGHRTVHSFKYMKNACYIK